MIGRRRGGMSLGRVAKKAAVATVVNRVVNNAMDQRQMNQQLNRQMQHQQQMQPQQQVMTKTCGSCRTNNPNEAKFCLNCGCDFNQAPQTQTLSNCTGCHANLAGINGNFCPYCRTAIR